MRGILIDPFKQKVDVRYDDFQEENVVHHYLETVTRTVVPLEGKNYLVLDIDGPFKADQKWWGFKGFPDMVCGGKGLVLGMDIGPQNQPMFKVVPPDANIDMVKGLVEWIDEEEAHRRLTGKVDSALFGSIKRVLVDRAGNVYTIQ
jgi:hypothetical protein